MITCRYDELRRGLVTPKYNGQQFHVVDLDEVWVYPWDFPDGWVLYDLRVQPRKWPMHSIIVVVIAFALLGFDIWMIWILFSRLEWL